MVGRLVQVKQFINEIKNTNWEDNNLIRIYWIETGVNKKKPIQHLLLWIGETLKNSMRSDHLPS